MSIIVLVLARPHCQIFKYFLRVLHIEQNKNRLLLFICHRPTLQLIYFYFGVILLFFPRLVTPRGTLVMLAKGEKPLRLLT
jgi:hypothetical protein